MSQGSVPGMPVQSMPAGWLKQITLTKERVNVLEKMVSDLAKRVAEVEKRPVQVGTMLNIPQPTPEAPWVAVTTEPVKRGPGRPRKVQA